MATIIWAFHWSLLDNCFCFCLLGNSIYLKEAEWWWKPCYVYLDLRVLNAVATPLFYWVVALLMWCISHDISCFKWPNPQVNRLKWTVGNLLAHIIHLLKRQKWSWLLGLKARTETSLVWCSMSWIFLSASFALIIFSMWQKT